VGVDIPFRPTNKNDQFKMRASTSESTLRSHHNPAPAEASSLARNIRERHKQVKSHFREIKRLLDEPADICQQVSKLTRCRDHRGIKKTELTANDVFTEKELLRLDQDK